MSQSTDIRAWAKEQGIDVNPRGPIAKTIVEQWHEQHPIDTPDIPDTDGSLTFTMPDYVAQASESDTGESTPNVGGKKKSFTDRFKRKKPSGDGVAVVKTRRRSSLELGGSILWSGIANMVGNTGNPSMIPVARCIDFQAPVAGAVIDEALKGTLIDRMLQPVARAGDKLADVGALIMPPLIVGAIAQRPSMYPKLKPVLEECLYRWYEIAGPIIEKRKARAKKRAEQMGDVNIDELIALFFAPIEQPVPGSDSEVVDAEVVGV